MRELCLVIVLFEFQRRATSLFRFFFFKCYFWSLTKGLPLILWYMNLHETNNNRFKVVINKIYMQTPSIRIIILHLQELSVCVRILFSKTKTGTHWHRAIDCVIPYRFDTIQHFSLSNPLAFLIRTWCLKRGLLFGCDYASRFYCILTMCITSFINDSLFLVLTEQTNSNMCWFVHIFSYDLNCRWLWVQRQRIKLNGCVGQCERNGSTSIWLRWDRFHFSFVHVAIVGDGHCIWLHHDCCCCCCCCRTAKLNDLNEYTKMLTGMSCTCHELVSKTPVKCTFHL